MKIDFSNIGGVVVGGETFGFVPAGTEFPLGRSVLRVNVGDNWIVRGYRSAGPLLVIDGALWIDVNVSRGDGQFDTTGGYLSRVDLEFTEIQGGTGSPVTTTLPFLGIVRGNYAGKARVQGLTRATAYRTEYTINLEGGTVATYRVARGEMASANGNAVTLYSEVCDDRTTRPRNTGGWRIVLGTESVFANAIEAYTRTT